MTMSETRRNWEAANPEKLKAIRQRRNELLRKRRIEQKIAAGEDPQKYTHTKNLTPEQLEARTEQKRKYAREWARAHKEEASARKKERMLNDPEYAAKVRETWARAAAKRREKGRPPESAELREKRRQRDREYRAKKIREKKMMEALLPAKENKVAKEQAPSPLKPPVYHKPRMGRLQALSKWYGY